MLVGASEPDPAPNLFGNFSLPGWARSPSDIVAWIVHRLTFFGGRVIEMLHTLATILGITSIVIVNMIWECPFWCGVLTAFNCFPVAVNTAVKGLIQCITTELPSPAACRVAITSSLVISAFMTILLLMLIGVGSSIWLVTPPGRTDRHPSWDGTSTSTSTPRRYDPMLLDRELLSSQELLPPPTRLYEGFESFAATAITKFALAPWPSAPSQARFDSDSFQVGIDTQSSRCISFNKAHFEDLHLENVGDCTGLGGNQVAILGFGTLVFTIQDDSGRWHTHRVPNSLYIPNAKKVLICPQHWAQEAKDNSPLLHGTCEMTTHSGTILFWDQRRYRRTLSLHPSTNTPVFHSRAGNRIMEAFAATHEAMDASAPAMRERTILLPPGSLLTHHPSQGDAWDGVELINTASPDEPGNVPRGDAHKMGESIGDTSPAIADRHTEVSFDIDNSSGSPTSSFVQTSIDEDHAESLESPDRAAELMRYHYRLGHLSFQKLQLLARIGEIPRALADIKPPACSGCLFGAMTKTPWRTKPKKDAEASRIFPATKPGEVVSVDQMQSTAVGFIAQLKGRLTTKRYTCATVFVDHYSRYRFVHLQQTLSSADTLAAKKAFELHAASMGVTIKHYQCDNGRFQDNAFLNSCRESNQRVSFCPVNAHFQNGIAERCIRDLTENARKMLLFAMGRWKSAVDLSLWPYAVRTAAYIHNHIPCDEQGRSRIELFGGTAVMTNLNHFHTFGCPVFVLDSNLASGKHIGRWLPRSRLGLYLGPSPIHARSVSLVLNLATGLVSPQFHCRHDEFFESVRDEVSDYPWKSVARLQLQAAVEVPPPTSVPTPAPMTSVEPSSPDAAPPVDTTLSEGDYGFMINATDPLLDPAPADTAEDDWMIVDTPTTPAPAPASPEVPVTATTSVTHNLSDSAPANQTSAPVEQPSVSSRGRIRRPTQRLQESMDQDTRAWGRSARTYVGMASTLQDDVPVEAPIDYDAEHDAHLQLQDRMRHPIAFLSEMVGDTMYYHQAMRQSDAPQFTAAVVKEINGHVENNTWELVRREDVPDNQEVVPSVWSMKRKRDLTTGEITKWKARLNLHGGKQTFGVNYFDTWSPVIAWSSVRLIICFALIFKWSVRQIDFVQAFCQAPIEMDMWMELPHGITVKGGSSRTHVLKLLANIYGQKQGSKVWHDYLVGKLRDIGFVPSTVDECVFYRGTSIFVLYVDDGLAFDMTGKSLDNLVQELRDVDLDVEDLGYPSDYIGVNLSKDEDTFHFTQRALIDSIIEDAGLTNSRKTKPVPAKSSQLLHSFPNSPPFDGPFNMRSIVGKLNYLAQTTRPDIMQAVHAIAKYASNPKKEHGDAVLYLVMYLKKTRHIGLLFKPDPTKGFEDYCDADFIGQYHEELSAVDPSTSKSRSGWIIFYAGCPIIWASRLQTQVALSTTEAEYISLSQSLRDVIPVMALVSEMKSKGFPVLCTEPYVYCKLFEDNSGALEIARLPKMRPRTRHLCVTLHHFREHVRLGLVKLFPISTELQTADVLTKPTPQNIFVPHRIKMCGQ